MIKSDVYDTARYGQAMADLLGHHAGANGQLFHPADGVLKATRNYGAIAFVERELASAKSDPSGAYVLENGARLTGDAYRAYSCAFGASVDGSGRLEHARDIGQVWVSGASGACTASRSYKSMRELADTAISEIAR